ncbi:hypothetical protein P280DRAFT_245052 [Massarina eburnea CBS 473.64]|uniref:Uncharacterized protein n=1 Tax=Massarina eburnea CBS 473.64 TaxID=1395130 RepID=A0A6A6S6G0_9PLEO|nr:hypothetical protein P280DRAFT_245052 [Massarina eburnea CBS 473.64]
MAPCIYPRYRSHTLLPPRRGVWYLYYTQRLSCALAPQFDPLKSQSKLHLQRHVISTEQVGQPQSRHDFWIYFLPSIYKVTDMLLRVFERSTRGGDRSLMSGAGSSPVIVRKRENSLIILCATPFPGKLMSAITHEKPHPLSPVRLDGRVFTPHGPASL